MNEDTISFLLSKLYAARRRRDYARGNNHHEEAMQMQEYMDAHKTNAVKLIYEYGMEELPNVQGDKK